MVPQGVPQSVPSRRLQRSCLKEGPPGYSPRGVSQGGSPNVCRPNLVVQVRSPKGVGTRAVARWRSPKRGRLSGVAQGHPTGSPGWFLQQGPQLVSPSRVAQEGSSKGCPNGCPQWCPPRDSAKRFPATILPQRRPAGWYPMEVLKGGHKKVVPEAGSPKGVVRGMSPKDGRRMVVAQLLSHKLGRTRGLGKGGSPKGCRPWGVSQVVSPRVVVEVGSPRGVQVWVFPKRYPPRLPAMGLDNGVPQWCNLGGPQVGPPSGVSRRWFTERVPARGSTEGGSPRGVRQKRVLTKGSCEGGPLWETTELHRGFTEGGHPKGVAKGGSPKGCPIARVREGVSLKWCPRRIVAQMVSSIGVPQGFLPSVSPKGVRQEVPQAASHRGSPRVVPQGTPQRVYQWVPEGSPLNVVHQVCSTEGVPPRRIHFWGSTVEFHRTGVVQGHRRRWFAHCGSPKGVAHRTVAQVVHPRGSPKVCRRRW